MVVIGNGALKFKQISVLHSSSLLAEGFSLPPHFQKGGAWQNLSSQISVSQRVVTTNDRATFLMGGGGSFHIKNKLKSEIFHDKKCFLSVITKKLNWEMLTKNLVKTLILCGFTKNLIYCEVSRKTNILGGIT